jgi:hypothetical protein
MSLSKKVKDDNLQTFLCSATRDIFDAAEDSDKFDDSLWDETVFVRSSTKFVQGFGKIIHLLNFSARHSHDGCQS